MESSNQNSSGQPNVEPAIVNANGDWRDQFPPDARQQVIHRIMKMLTKMSTSPEPAVIKEATEISMKYEERIYQFAKSQKEYGAMIFHKLHQMETKYKQQLSKDGTPLESGSSAVQPQVHAQQQSLTNSVAANPSQVPQQLVSQSGPNITSREQGSAAVQPSPNVVSQNSQRFASPHSQMAATQQTLPHQQSQDPQYLSNEKLQQRVLEQKFQQGNHNLSRPMMSAHNLSQPSQLRSSQQTVLQTPSSVQSPINQSASFASLQHSQQQSAQSMLHRPQQHTIVTPQQQQSPQSMLHRPQQHTVVTPQQQQSAQSMLHRPQQHTVVTPQQQQSPQSMLHRPQQHTVVTPQQQQSAQSKLHRPQQHTVVTPQQQQSPQSRLHRPQQHTVVTSQQQQSLQSILHRPQQHTVVTPQQQQQRQVIRQHIRGTSIGQQPNLQQQSHPANLQQRLMMQQNSLPIAQDQQLGSRSNVSGLSHNHSSHMMPQSKVSLQQRPQQAGASTIAAESQQLQLTKPLHPRVSGSLQNVVEQQTQSDRPLIEPASGSTGPIGHANGGDWREEVYQKIQSMKAMCLPAVQQIHQKAVAQLEKTATLTTDQIERMRRYKTKMEYFVKVLQCSKSDISPALKETWPLYEKHILDCVKYGGRKPMPSNQNSMTRLQNASVSQQTRPSNISAQGNTVMSSGSLQTNSGNRNNSSLPSQTGKDMLHRNSSMVSHQLEQKTLQQLKQHEQHQSMQNRKQQFHQEARHKISQEAVHEYPSEGQKTAHSIQSVKQGSKYELSSSQQLQAASPLSAVCISPHPDQNNILSSNVNTGTPLRSSNSPTVVPVESGHQQTPAPSVALGTQELNNEDSSSKNYLTVVSGKPIVTEQPIQRLMRAVASISTEALISAERDITSVTMLVDRLAASGPGENSRAAIGNDLAADTKSFLRTGTSHVKSMCRHFNPEPIAINSFKRRRIEDTAPPLLKEIREINQQLFDTVVDIADNKVDPSAVAVSSKGTLVTFSTIPVTLGPQLKSHFSAHRLRIQPLRFLVPSSYPNCAPILLDDVSADISNKDEDLGSKALERFKLTLKTLSEVKSLKVIARTWEACARAVISEYAKQIGFSSFTSKASAWETCL